jgi:VanZ family protein
MDLAAPSGQTPNFLARTCAGLCIPALAALSWTPGPYMVRTGVLSGHEEHFLAYLISGFVVAATSHRSHYAKLVCALCSYAALLELGQYAIPGRHPALEDFSASSFGALIGIGVITLIRRARVAYF